MTNGEELSTIDALINTTKMVLHIGLTNNLTVNKVVVNTV